MAIYAIADLHLSFSQNKPMNIFGNNWEDHSERLKENWLQKVNKDDYIILAGDFSWATYLNDTKADFEYLNTLPGNKILLKGNHDYWWTTVAKMENFIQENNFENISFLHNNSYFIENKIIVGTRAWNILDKDENSKMIKREAARLELSIQNGINKYGLENETIAFLHYPPITLNTVKQREENEFIKILNKYNIRKCYYGHLHGVSHKDAVIGNINGIEYELISSDYLNFDLKLI